MLVSGHVFIEIVLVQTNYSFAVFWKHSITWQSSLYGLNNHATRKKTNKKSTQKVVDGRTLGHQSKKRSTRNAGKPHCHVVERKGRRHQQHLVNATLHVAATTTQKQRSQKVLNCQLHIQL